MNEERSRPGGGSLMAQTLLPQIFEALWFKDLSPAYRVWAVLDGARDARVYSAVVGCYADNCCLYSGDLPSDLKLAAPYLVSLDPEDRTTQYILKRGWGNSWGIFLRSTSSMETLRRHLKKFLVVKDHTSRRLLFRYYDPRVLRVYLPTCWPAELETLFGPVKAFMVEGEDSATMIQYRVDEGRLVEKVATLKAASQTKAL
jgi:hypothetical protein